MKRAKGEVEEERRGARGSRWRAQSVTPADVGFVPGGGDGAQLSLHGWGCVSVAGPLLHQGPPRPLRTYRGLGEWVVWLS